jgi:polyhydroxyalkanoate synthase subunit PhaC
MPRVRHSRAKVESSLFPMFFVTDALRRSLGCLLDEAPGFAPQERASQIVLEASELRLRRYDQESADVGPVLIAPAPIKRGYIFDLLPEVSVVGRLVQAGFSVYSIDWRESANGDLETSIGSLGKALEKIAAEHNRTPIVIGHSLGGTLAAIAAALNPDGVEKLVLIEAPLRFGDKTGALRPMALYSTSMRESCTPGLIPGSLLDVASVGAAPDEFVFGLCVDAWSSLPDINALSIHARVVRWSLDEFAPSAGLVSAVVDLLYSQDLFARNELCLLGRLACSRALHNMPVAAIVDYTSRLIPPASTLDPLDNPTVFEYAPEIGVGLQHVGPLVGRRAHRTIWPRVIEWMRA